MKVYDGKAWSPQFSLDLLYLFSVYFLINDFTSAGASWSFSTIFSPLTPIR